MLLNEEKERQEQERLPNTVGGDRSMYTHK